MIDLYLINKFLLNNLVNIEKLSKYSQRNSNSRNSRRNSGSIYSRNSRRNSNSRNSRRNSGSIYSINLFNGRFWGVFFWFCYSIWITIKSLQYYVNCNNSEIGITVLIPLMFSTIYSFIHYILDDCKKIN